MYKKVKNEVIYIVNIACTSCDLDIAITLARNGTMELLIYILKNETLPNTILLALESLKKLLKWGKILKNINKINPISNQFEELNGKDTLENLTYNQNHSIYDYVSSILKEFFSENNNDDDIDNEINLKDTEMN